MIIGLDPGPKESAVVIWDGRRVVNRMIDANENVLYNLLQWRNDEAWLAIEMIASYGMPVGKETFETCVWIGRFIQAYNRMDRTILVPRLTIKTHHCHSSKANDATIRQAILDRFGGKDSAIGRKSSPGPLYAIVADMWSALAIALWASDTQAARDRGAA